LLFAAKGRRRPTLLYPAKKKKKKKKRGGDARRLGKTAVFMGGGRRFTEEEAGTASFSRRAGDTKKKKKGVASYEDINKRGEALCWGGGEKKKKRQVSLHCRRQGRGREKRGAPLPRGEEEQTPGRRLFSAAEGGGKRSPYRFREGKRKSWSGWPERKGAHLLEKGKGGGKSHLNDRCEPESRCKKKGGGGKGELASPRKKGNFVHRPCACCARGKGRILGGEGGKGKRGTTKPGVN